MGSPPASGLASGSGPVLDPLFGTDAAPPGNDRQAQTGFIKRLEVIVAISYTREPRSPVLQNIQASAPACPNGM
jgi:hypothetical protein